MKIQVLLTMGYNNSGEAAEEMWNRSLDLGVEGLIELAMFCFKGNLDRESRNGQEKVHRAESAVGWTGTGRFEQGSGNLKHKPHQFGCEIHQVLQTWSWQRQGGVALCYGLRPRFSIRPRPWTLQGGRSTPEKYLRWCLNYQKVGYLSWTTSCHSTPTRINTPRLRESAQCSLQGNRATCSEEYVWRCTVKGRSWIGYLSWITDNQEYLI